MLNFFEKIHRAARYKRLTMIRASKSRHTLPNYTNCKNCETELQGMYCHKCGQYALANKQSFWRFIVEYFSNTYQTDDRALNTLKLLVFYPGFLSREFVRGRVASYVHPMKLYLFSSIVFFTLIFLFAWPQYDNKTGNFQIQKTEQVAAAPSEQITAATIEVKNSDIVNSYKKEKFVELTTGVVKQYLPLLLLFCMPLYGLLLWLFFRKPYSGYMPHFVYAIHINIFILILSLIMSLLGAWGAFSWYVMGVAWVILSVYVIFATRNFYGQGWVKTIYKSFLTFCICFVLCFFIVVISLGVIWVGQIEALKSV